MRKYLKPAFEMEAFDVEDVITASGDLPPEIEEIGSEGGGIIDGTLSAPVELDFN